MNLVNKNMSTLRILNHVKPPINSLTPPAGEASLNSTLYRINFNKAKSSEIEDKLWKLGDLY
jgi:hypothetical protein